MTLGKMLEESAQRTPRKCAIKFDKKKISYQELSETVKQASHSFVESGLQQGDRVGIFCNNCPEYIITYFAVLTFGGIAVPINNFLTGNEVKYIVNDCQIKILVTSPKFLKTVQPMLSQMASVQQVIVIGGEEQTDHISFDTFLQTPSSKEMQNTVSDDDLAVFIYTSGTTGHPKGAMLTHRNMYSNAQDSAEATHFITKDKLLLFLPMFHSFTFTVCVITPLLLSATIILLGSVKSFDEIKKAILWDRVTIFIGVPAVFNVLAGKPLPKILKYIHAIKFFISGSAPLPAPVIKKIEDKFGSPLCEGYGLSEASPVVAVNPRFKERKPGSVGLPLPHVEVKIVDAEMNEKPRGEIGELAVKGPNVMQGYYNMPEETARTLIDGWLLTGDIAKIDQDGYVFIVDRKKEMLLVRGINVYPREIEDVLYSHPDIVECAVIGVPDESKGEVPKAFMVVGEGKTLTEKEVKRFCKDHLAAYKLPKYFEFRDALPKNATQKIMKRELQ